MTRWNPSGNIGFRRSTFYCLAPDHATASVGSSCTRYSRTIRMETCQRRFASSLSFNSGFPRPPGSPTNTRRLIPVTQGLAASTLLLPLAAHRFHELLLRDRNRSQGKQKVFAQARPLVAP